MKHAVTMGLVITTMIALWGCGDKESPAPAPKAGEVQEEMEQAVDAAADYAYTQKEQFLSTLNSQLDTLDKQISDLKTAAEKEGAELTEDSKAMIADLEKKAADLRKNVTAAGDKSEDAWAAAQKELNQAMKDLQDAYKKAAEELK